LAAFSFGSFLFRRNNEREKNTGECADQGKIAVVARIFPVKAAHSPLKNSIIIKIIVII